MTDCVRCKDCKKPFIMKDEAEYILSYCEGCDKLLVLYKINPAILARDDQKVISFVSSGPGGKCRKCSNMVTMRNNKDYVSIRCVECGFGIVYKMSTHKGVARFIGSEEFDKTKYWLSGKRAHDRKLKEEGAK
jgi:hypothetical protein